MKTPEEWARETCCCRTSEPDGKGCTLAADVIEKIQNEAFETAKEAAAAVCDNHDIRDSAHNAHSYMLAQEIRGLVRK